MVKNNKTYLVVPSAHAKYAKQHGAQFDQQERQWFVSGDVPDELSSYLIKPARTRDYTKEKGLACPDCHAPMVVRRARSGDRPPFWGCTRYPNCHGTRTMNETVADTQWQRAPEPLLEAPQETPPPGDTDAQLRHIVAETLLLCRSYLPDGQQWKVWLHAPRVRFGNKAALDVMTTVEGCQDVQELLRESFGAA